MAGADKTCAAGIVGDGGCSIERCMIARSVIHISRDGGWESVRTV